MSEEGKISQTGQPVMGKGAGGNVYLLPVCKDYETVAASQTAQVLGATGATGDYLEGLLIIPGTTSPGEVDILDGATSIMVFKGGATSVADLKPFFVPIKAFSTSGAWKVTTGANVTAIGVGSFT